MPSYDVIVGGGGPAGCSAALFTARSDLETLLLDVVTDYRREVDGYWDELADYTDWVVQQKAREAARRRQSHQIDEGEIGYRTERAHRRLVEHIDDGLVRERAQEFDAREASQ